MFTYSHRFKLVSNPKATKSCDWSDSFKANINLLSSKLPKVFDWFNIQSIFLSVFLSDRKMTLVSDKSTVTMDINSEFATLPSAMAGNR